MSYQVLARKWRPRTFASLVGQEHVVRALTHALTEQRLHHAYLFTGTRGVGKTTLARILAKAVNCETGISATPCGVCSACREIDSGRFVDLLEVDAATNTRVDEMRQLLENAVYAPTRGRFKVYVIDEVHMLSTSAFNAMLKTLEEPPEHVKFILATTDPQKIPVTVLSRCLQFNLKQMPQALIARHLAQILEAETIRADPGALQLLARSAAGSMRDALSLLDQAIAHGSGSVELAPVREMLGAVDADHVFSILEALLDADANALLAVAEDLAARSLSFEAALQEMASLLTRLQIAQFAPQAVAGDLPERDRLLALAARIEPEFVQLAYQIVVQGRQELTLAPDEHAGFVMTLLRLHAFVPCGDDRLPPTRPPDGGSVGGRLPVASGVPAGAADAGKGSAVRAQRTATSGELVPVVEKSAQTIARPAGVGPEPRPWHELLAGLKVGGIARELAQHCELRNRTDGRIVLRLPPKHRYLLMKPGPDRLQQALVELLGSPVQLSIEVDEVAGDTPAVMAERDRRERTERAFAVVEQDSFVREVIEMFDATLIESSIKPV
ncbi:DNA polymerase III subunit gamma/tau [Accumulibacter sp.]|uniref:DNA polymerase III subunit gamma/tau n=1 Tax=Accumulibacter sp. TaxID=2053492 RepID=UPI0025EA4055|nr:DNA polymerase III subunit gamma/tau [Accumulibacter sp.]MCM8595495.1 DNA polymerase III subunit gamma/tau [Accumulibacter sp.]MCM8626823.1 DNA polymerase III subunit gamma/tau [Accumulibacter sp.]MDS4049642.1 DNA polymerase III subunit gamma/tau [Accumulibacter sp.]